HAWNLVGSQLSWQPATPVGLTYTIGDLGSKRALKLHSSGAYPVGVKSVQANYQPTSPDHAVSVSVDSRRAISNGDFADGQWSTVSNCAASPPPAKPNLSAAVVPNEA